MNEETAVVHLEGLKDKFSISLQVLTNVGSLIPNKKIDPSEEFGAVVVSISEESDFLGLGEFVEFHKLILDLTPTRNGEYWLCATLCYQPPQDDYMQDADDDDTLPERIKLTAKLERSDVKGFVSLTSKKKFFYAIFSTPSYEGRAVIKHKTGTVAAKAYEERLYKIQ